MAGDGFYQAAEPSPLYVKQIKLALLVQQGRDIALSVERHSLKNFIRGHDASGFVRDSRLMRLTSDFIQMSTIRLSSLDPAPPTRPAADQCPTLVQLLYYRIDGALWP